MSRHEDELSNHPLPLDLDFGAPAVPWGGGEVLAGGVIGHPHQVAATRLGVDGVRGVVHSHKLQPLVVRPDRAQIVPGDNKIIIKWIKN